MTGTRPWLGGLVSAIAALLVLPAAAAASVAGTGGAPTAAGGAPAPPSPRGKPVAEPVSGSLSLISARATPRKTFYDGVRHPSLRFTIGSDLPRNDLRIDVVDRAGRAVTSFYRNGVEPNVEYSIRWDGSRADGKPAREGRYRFRISPQDGSAAAISRRPRSSSGPRGLGFAIYGYAFPLLGAHDFGSSGARFGAGRSGHTHQGHDVLARCGVPVVAARGGRVKYSGYQGAAGNYVVIDGRGTGYDMAYMHLLRPSPLKVGKRVRTGQPIGLVGSTGSSTACHLHFEIWSAPGWYSGGSPIDPLPLLLRWDRYS